MNDPITVAEASETYQREKVGAGHRVTLRLIAKRFGLKSHDLYNFRRDLSPTGERSPTVSGEK